MRSGEVPVEIGRIRRNPGKLELAGWCRSVIGDSQQESDRSGRPVAAVRIAGRIPHEVIICALLGARNGGGTEFLFWCSKQGVVLVVADFASGGEGFGADLESRRRNGRGGDHRFDIKGRFVVTVLPGLSYVGVRVVRGVRA